VFGVDLDDDALLLVFCEDGLGVVGESMETLLDGLRIVIGSELEINCTCHWSWHD
jgi:hypothetical protein